jgi:uncharacterized membrane protein (UPF0127 family)
MPGQAIVTIGASSWLVSLATTPEELVAGLSGVASMDAGTGMLFDTGYDHVIGVTTEQMLFNLDIVFIDSGFQVVEVKNNVAPGVIFDSSVAARYFMEVNAGELGGVSVGDSITLEITVPPTSEVSFGDIWAVMGIMLPAVIFGVFGIALVKGMFAKKEVSRPGEEYTTWNVYFRDGSSTTYFGTRSEVEARYGSTAGEIKRKYT